MIKKYILFFLLLILIVLYFKIYYKNKSYYSIQESQNIIQNENYINHFNKLDKHLRKCGSNVKECQDFYKSNVLELNNIEKTMLDKVVHNLYKILDERLSYIFKYIKFIKVSNNIENSMPHTRGRAIVFSKNYFSQMLDKYKINKDFLFEDINLIRLISHEQFHIFQRFNKSKFEKFYYDNWNFKKLKSELPNELKEIVRTNPDALPNNNWVFHVNKNKYILPLCVYNSKYSENINDTSNIYIELIKESNNTYKFPNLKKQILEKKLLIDNKKFNDFFGYKGANNYHPNEISASLFELIVLEYSKHKKKHILYKTNNQKEYSEAYILLKEFIFN